MRVLNRRRPLSLSLSLPKKKRRKNHRDGIFKSTVKNHRYHKILIYYIIKYLKSKKLTKIVFIKLLFSPNFRERQREGETERETERETQRERQRERERQRSACLTKMALVLWGTKVRSCSRTGKRISSWRACCVPRPSVRPALTHRSLI